MEKSMFNVNGKAIEVEFERLGDDSGYDAAAKKYIHSVRKNSRQVAIRVTGTPGKSGMYQAYVKLDNGTLSSIGNNFHISEI